MAVSGRSRNRTVRQSMSFALAALLGPLLLATGAASGAPSEASSAPSVTNAMVPNVSASAARRSVPKLRQVDGGPGYYGRFSNALPSKPSYFPIGVWFESVLSQRDINLDKDVGLNTYVVLTANSNLRLLRKNGMKALLQQEEWQPSEAAGPQTAGWELDDEIDMEMGPDAGYAELLRIKRSLPADRRLRYNNFGKGVVFWETNIQARRFVNAVDIPSTDIYWFSDSNVCGFSEGGRLFAAGKRPLSSAECRRASNYGAQVKRVRSLVSPRGSKPVWTFVELAPIGALSLTPPQIRAAVWHALIAGARGITYFNHSFREPCRTQHALRDPCYARVRALVKSVNAQVKSLAPVLNAPFVYVSVEPQSGNEGNGEVGGRTLLRVCRVGRECFDYRVFFDPVRRGCVGDCARRAEEDRRPARDVQRLLRRRQRRPHLPHRRRFGLRSEATFLIHGAPTHGSGDRATSHT